MKYLLRLGIIASLWISVTFIYLASDLRILPYTERSLYKDIKNKYPNGRIGRIEVTKPQRIKGSDGLFTQKITWLDTIAPKLAKQHYGTITLEKNLSFTYQLKDSKLN